METNTLNLFEAGRGITASVYGSAYNVLDGVNDAITGDNMPYDIVGILGVVLGALLVIWGLWYVVRRLMRAMRATGN